MSQAFGLRKNSMFSNTVHRRLQIFPNLFLARLRKIRNLRPKNLEMRFSGILPCQPAVIARERSDEAIQTEAPETLLGIAPQGERDDRDAFEKDAPATPKCPENALLKTESLPRRTPAPIRALAIGAVSADQNARSTRFSPDRARVGAIFVDFAPAR